ncbi:MAG: hypothetical protein PHE43_03700 [Candidatus Nanoarchaeia archaeon]|nr:hypothetical protein [Candidatus Nanoarchaeia archaeon]
MSKLSIDYFLPAEDMSKLLIFYKNSDINTFLGYGPLDIVKIVEASNIQIGKNKDNIDYLIKSAWKFVEYLQDQTKKNLPRKVPVESVAVKFDELEFIVDELDQNGKDLCDGSSVQINGGQVVINEESPYVTGSGVNDLATWHEVINSPESEKYPRRVITGK